MPKLKYFLVLTFTILITLISNSCSNKKDKLIVDEIFISVHNVAPPLGETIYFTPPGTMPPKNWEAKPDTLFEFCIKGNLISHSIYNPRLIIKVDQAEEIKGYIKNCTKVKEGYFQFSLSDSLLTYFNNQIEKMNFTKLDTLYSDEGEGFLYDGPRYFLLIKKDGIEKQIMIMHDHKGPRNIIQFVDSLYNYLDKMELVKSINFPLGLDTLIVKKHNQYWDKRLEKYKSL